MNQNKQFIDKMSQKRSNNDLNPTYGLTKKARNAFLGKSTNETNCPYATPPATPHTPKTSQPFTVMTPRPNQRAQLNMESPYFRNKPLGQVAIQSGPVFPTPVAPRNNLALSKRQPTNCILSGTVEKILLWQSLRVHVSIPCLFEVLGHLDYVRNGTNPFLKIFMMRNDDSGPVLKVMFYEIDRPLLALDPGQKVSVVGVLRGRSCLQAYKISKITQQDMVLAQHITFICDITAKDATKASKI